MEAAADADKNRIYRDVRWELWEREELVSIVHQVKDLVCGMSIDVQKARFKVSYVTKTYYFCSNKCLELFKRRAEQYSKDFLEALPPTRLMEEC